MALGQIGPLTAAFEALATAVGAGIVLGGFATGASGLIARRPRQDVEARVLEDGYMGGIVGTLVAFADLATRYIV